MIALVTILCFAQPKALEAIPRQGAVVLDGRLDEPAWLNAPLGDGFVERNPYPGSSPPVNTTVKVIYDHEHLWIGVRAQTLPGEQPRALELTRDDLRIFGDDAISIKLDVRRDRRTTLGFATNPAGAQLDYVAVEGGDSFRREFDAIWRVETSVDAEGWTSEFELPWIALGLPEGDGPRTLGINITRDHVARLATYDWSAMPAEFGPVAALYYGELTGMKNVAGGLPLTLLPFVRGAYDTTRATPWDAGLGGDLRLRAGVDAWVELTLLTDFAQVDLDDPVVNLSRFQLFFPERRPFFLSGLEIFEVGVTGQTQVYFSRRIGLDDDNRPLPLWGGFKAYGSAGQTRFGVLQVLTADNSSNPSASFTVARARHNFGENGHIGAIATLQGDVDSLSRDALGPRPFVPNLSWATDGAIRLAERRLELQGFLAGAHNQDEDGFAGRMAVAWRGLEVQPKGELSFVSEDFDPRAGFVIRQDLIRSRVDLDWIGRTERYGLQSIAVNVGAQSDRAYSDGVFLGHGANLHSTIIWRSGWAISGGLSTTQDFVREPFELVDRVPVPADRYASRNIYVNGTTPPGKLAQLYLGYGYTGNFYGGTLHTVEADGSLAFGPHFKLRGNGKLSLISFSEATLRARGGSSEFEAFNILTASLALVVSPSTTLSLDGIAQVNTGDERLNTLVRVRWRYLPGSDLFLVYRQVDDRADASGDERSLTLKVTWRTDVVF